MLTRVDVLVVGLGPAGASAAQAAAAAGASVLAVDRRAQPGLPVQCAELVPEPVLALCPEARGSTVQRVTGIDSRHGVAAAAAPFAGWMLDRARLDRSLVEGARQRGAAIRFGCSARPAADGTVRLSDGSGIGAAAIVAADGPASSFASAADARQPAFLHTRQLRVHLRGPLDRAHILLRQAFGGGYAWLFPRGGEGNLGLGVEATARRSLAARLQALTRALRRRGLVAGSSGPPTGGAIPVGGLRVADRCLAGVPVLLAGDAAALTHPISGAGIAAALESGRLAGAAAAAVAAGRAAAADDYADEVRDVFGPAHARALARRGRRLAAGEIRPTWIGFPDYWEAAA